VTVLVVRVIRRYSSLNHLTEESQEEDSMAAVTLPGLAFVGRIPGAVTD